MVGRTTSSSVFCGVIVEKGFEGKGALGDDGCHLDKEGGTEGEEGIGLSLCEIVDDRFLELIEEEVLGGVEVFGEIS